MTLGSNPGAGPVAHSTHLGLFANIKKLARRPIADIALPNHIMEDLRERWMHVHKDYLPSLAKARDPSQKHWPVHLDHCFARIILDNAIGIAKPWTEVLKLPAVRNMDKNQLESVIKLAERIATGEVDLNALNEHSLQIRNKKRKINGESHTQHLPKRQRHEKGTISSYFLRSPSSSRTKTVFTTAKTDLPNMSELEDADDSEGERMKVQLRRIANSDLTDFRKQALSLLCQVPRGRHSTYQAMSDYITTTSHKTCARAVGNAMRNNPFAPVSNSATIPNKPFHAFAIWDLNIASCLRSRLGMANIIAFRKFHAIAS